MAVQQSQRERKRLDGPPQLPMSGVPRERKYPKGNDQPGDAKYLLEQMRHRLSVRLVIHTPITSHTRTEKVFKLS